MLSVCSGTKCAIDGDPMASCSGPGGAGLGPEDVGGDALVSSAAARWRASATRLQTRECQIARPDRMGYWYSDGVDVLARRASRLPVGQERAWDFGLEAPLAHGRRAIKDALSGGASNVSHVTPRELGALHLPESCARGTSHTPCGRWSGLSSNSRPSVGITGSSQELLL